MTRKIRSYNDLLQEEQQLQQLLQAQKELLRYDIQGLKEELKPAATALSFLGRVTTRDRHNLLLTEGANKLIDLVIKKVVLARAGWLTKLTVPFFVKNYSSHFIAEQKDKWLEKLFSLFQKNGHSQAAPIQEEEEL